MSRQGAERFGVSAASAVRWVESVNTTGRVETARDLLQFVSVVRTFGTTRVVN